MPSANATAEDQFHQGQAPGQELVRAVVLISKANGSSTAARRPSRGERRSLIELRRSEAEDAFPAIDAILKRFGGRRIGGATALGTVAVETTAEGIRMLRVAPVVEAIMEDQPLTAIR